MNTINPQLLPNVNTYKIYISDKNSRIKIQEKSKEAASQVNYLNRTARSQIKELNKTQINLLSFYQRKLSQFDRQIQKDQHKKMEQAKLQDLKNITTLNRYLHSLRIQQNTKHLMQKRKESATSIKAFHRESQELLNSSKNEEAIQLKRRNQAFSKANKLKKEWSLQKAFLQKKKLSSTIHGTLRKKQTIITEREIEKISDLSNKQKELMNIVEKTRKAQEKYSQSLKKAKFMNSAQIYNQLASNRSKSSKKNQSVLQF